MNAVAVLIAGGAMGFVFGFLFGSLGKVDLHRITTGEVVQRVMMSAVDGRGLEVFVLPHSVNNPIRIRYAQNTLTAEELRGKP